MIRKWLVMVAGWLVVSVVVCAVAPAAGAIPQEKPQEKPQDKPPAYTLPEYNAYQAAAKEPNPQQRIRLLDDFVAKYPSSALLVYAYQTYYTTYNELKNYPKTIEYADRLLTFGDKLDAGTQLQALYIRTLAFNYSFNEKAADAKEQATRARAAALAGLKVLGELKKPEGVSDDQFEQNKKGPTALFNYTAGLASLQLGQSAAAELTGIVKQRPAGMSDAQYDQRKAELRAEANKQLQTAIGSFKAALAANPNDAVTYFRLGIAYLQMEPSQAMDGFWALARSVALKGPGEAQVRTYLHNRLANYQQTGCDKLVNDQMNELIALAGSSAERPATFKIPSAAELQKMREDPSSNFIADLQAGGEKAKLMWLATCGLEFPEAGGKVIEVSGSDSVVLKLFYAPTAEAMEAGTVANMEVKVEGQPEAKRIQVGDGVRFSGTLASYDPAPFMLHWEKAKVNKEDIPDQPGKRPPKRPAKKSGR
jgi:tetratricopeptide (TPR) repeat protein